MTEKQEKRFYWPLWKRAVLANGWRAEKGRVCILANPPEPANTVISVAAGLAEAHHRATTPDDLRHATHVVALGHNCPHKAMRNHELSRWAWLMRLLIDPDDLNSMNHWLHPDLDEHESLNATISQMPQAIVIAICRNRFDRADWRNLDIEDKRSLHIQLKNRFTREHRPFAAAREDASA